MATRDLGPTPEVFFLVSAVALSALMFGAVEPWARAAAGLYVIVFFNAWTFRLRPGQWRTAFFQDWPLMGTAFGFMGVCFFQLVPVPEDILCLLSPAKRSLLLGMHVSGPQPISFDPRAGLTGISMVIVYIAVFLVASSLGDNRRVVSGVMEGLAAFGFALSVFALIQSSAGNGRIYWFRELTQGGSPFGPFVNRNHFAGLMGMLIPMGLGVALHSKKSEKSVLYVFFSVIMTLGLFFSLSRGALASFVLSIGIFVFGARHRISRSGMLFVTVFLASATLMILHIGPSSFFQKITTGGLADGERLSVWKSAISIFSGFPCLGTGLGSFARVFAIYGPGGFAHAHNDYIELAVETGLCGTSIVTMFFLLIVKKVAEYYMTGRPPVLMYALNASAAHMLFHGLADFNLHIPSNAIAFSVILGLMMSLARGGGDQVKESTE